MIATVGELDPGTGNQILNGGRDEHFPGTGQIGDAGADVDGESCDVLTATLNLTGVDAGAHVDPKDLHRATY